MSFGKTSCSECTAGTYQGAPQASACLACEQGHFCPTGASQAQALLSGRNYVIPDDLKELFVPVVAHRVLLAPLRETDLDTSDVLEEILDQVKVPA